MGQSWGKDNMSSLKGTTAIVTGANSGLGFETALALAQKDATVIMAVRSQEKGELAAKRIAGEVPQAKLHVLLLDLADLASIRQFVRTAGQQFDSVDLLINNAGVMMPPFQQTKDGFELQFGSNHLGTFALTGLLLPMLEQGDHSRVVTVSSMTAHRAKIDFDNLDGSKGYSNWRAYGQSKLANLLFAVQLQQRLQAKGSSTISLACHPGYANTNIGAKGSGGKQSIWMKLGASLLSQPAHMGALPLLYAAVAPSLKGGEYIGPSSLFGLRGYPEAASIVQRLYQPQVAARLWDLSEQLTYVSYPN